jgi:Acyl-CoA dehydrogenase, N-terminal domain
MGCSALALSVHTLACHPLMMVGTDEQRQEWLPEMLSGRRARARFPALGCQRGLSFGKPGQKMGLRAVPTTSAQYDDAYIPAHRRVGKDGQGLQIAFSALDSGRLASPQSPLAWPRWPAMPRSGRRSARRSSTIRDPSAQGDFQGGASTASGCAGEDRAVVDAHGSLGPHPGTAVVKVATTSGPLMVGRGWRSPARSGRRSG